jgi:putative oxidoreductase
MNLLAPPSSTWLNKSLAIIRIIVGLLLIYHGHEIFRPELMNEYLKWDMFKDPDAKFKVYGGKSAEFIAGIFLSLGLFTRPCAILIIGTFSFITFIIGHGHFWYEDQHPFMFALFGLLFLLTGPGAWSLDGLIFNKKA